VRLCQFLLDAGDWIYCLDVKNEIMNKRNKYILKEVLEDEPESKDYDFAGRIKAKSLWK